MTAPPKRRWFRFGLRTMFVVLVILAIPLGWLAWQIQIVRERKAIIEELRQASTKVEILRLRQGYFRHDASKFDYVRVSRIRRALGDESYLLIQFPASVGKELAERVELAFPEAELRAWPHNKWDTVASRDSLYRPTSDRISNSGKLFKTGPIHEQTYFP